MNKEIIFLHESFAASVAKDIVSVGSLTAAIGLGVYLNSVVLQVVGSILWMLTIFGRAMREMKNHTFSIADLRARLDEIDPPSPTQTNKEE